MLEEMQKAIKTIQDMIKSRIKLTKENLIVRGISEEQINELVAKLILEEKEDALTYKVKSIKIMFDLVINGVTLSEQELQKYGITECEIATFLHDKRLEKCSDGTYCLTEDTLKRLFYHSLDLKTYGYKDRAIQGYMKCLEIDPTYWPACIELIKHCLTEQRYNDAFNFFSNAVKDKQVGRRIHQENLLFALLFSIIIDIEDTKIKINGKPINVVEIPSLLLQSKSISEEDKRMKQIIEHIIRKDWVRAHELLLNIDLSNPQNSLLINLVRIAMVKSKEDDNQLLEYIDSNNYRAIRDKLKSDSKLRYQSNYEKVLLKLVEKLLAIIETKEIPGVIHTEEKGNTISDLIDRNDFERALDEATKLKEHASKTEIIKLNILIKLLEHIINEIDKDVKATICLHGYLTETCCSSDERIETLDEIGIKSKYIQLKEFYESYINFPQSAFIDEVFQAAKKIAMNTTETDPEEIRKIEEVARETQTPFESVRLLKIYAQIINKQKEIINDEVKEDYDYIEKSIKQRNIPLETRLKQLGYIREAKHLIRIYIAILCFKASNFIEGNEYMIDEHDTELSPKVRILLDYARYIERKRKEESNQMQKLLTPPSS